MRRSKLDIVRETANGRWLEILEAVVPDLKDACKKAGQHVPCPISGGKDGFRLFPDAKLTGGGISNQHGAFPNGFELIMWVANCSFTDALNDVSIYLGLDENWKSESLKPRTVQRSVDYKQGVQLADEKTIEKRKYALRRVWKGAFPIWHEASELARKYFKSRSIDVTSLNIVELGKTLRFHPRLELYHNNKLVGRYPCIIALVKYYDGQAASIHRTYLDHDGNKLKVVIDDDLVSSKKLMKSCQNRKLTGGAIRLTECTSDVIHIAEGIETALSVAMVKQETVWASVSAQLLESFEPPKGVNHIFVWADLDKSERGLEAAMALVERMDAKGINVTILCPNMAIPEESKGVDWNDILTIEGKDSFPKISHYIFQ